MDKSKICFIRAKQKDDYVFSGIQKSCYKIVIPYRDFNIFMRLCREAWFRLGLPRRDIWINPEVLNINEDIIIVKDPLIVKEFIRELRRKHPNKRIIMDYDNRVVNSIDPNSIREYVDEIWHYDENDCEKYRLKYKGHSYLDVYQIKTQNSFKYDVLYVGRDKGRLNQMEEMQAKLEDIGLKTCFHICANRAFLTWTKKIYKPFLPYKNYLDMLKHSRSILNIVPEGQTSITQREMEAVFDGIKCITNNKGIKDFELYDETRYFLLDDNYKLIPKFLSEPFKKIDKKELEIYTLDENLRMMLGDYLNELV